jgi:predicted extracellular nuclease
MDISRPPLKIRLRCLLLFPLKKTYPHTILLLLFAFVLSGAKPPIPEENIARQPERGDIRFVSYNVENLFDMVDDPEKADDEFLPWGMRGWKAERYNKKLKDIYKVLVNLGGWELPEIIGLIEVENRTVLEDLIERTPLSMHGYSIIHHDSPDARGIDVALIYRKEHFIPLYDEAIRVVFPFDTLGKTRDILYVSGVVNKRDTLHVFMCHFPSRRGGEATSAPRRIYVASLVRAKVDSLLAGNPNANIIVAGDFNDEPEDVSVREGLRAKGSVEEMGTGDLFNFMYAKKERGLGTYKFQGFWNMLDHIIVSQGLLDQSAGVFAPPHAAHIFRPEWLTVPDDNSPGVKPFYTFTGVQYTGGYSDHFPVYLDLFFVP